jgi:hypothetical protein
MFLSLNPEQGALVGSCKSTPLHTRFTKKLGLTNVDHEEFGSLFLVNSVKSLAESTREIIAIPNH